MGEQPQKGEAASRPAERECGSTPFLVERQALPVEVMEELSIRPAQADLEDRPGSQPTRQMNDQLAGLSVLHDPNELAPVQASRHPLAVLADVEEQPARADGLSVLGLQKEHPFSDLAQGLSEALDHCLQGREVTSGTRQDR